MSQLSTYPLRLPRSMRLGVERCKHKPFLLNAKPGLTWKALIS